MITAVIAPDNFNSLNILERFLPYKEVGVIALCETSKFGSDFTYVMQQYCAKHRVSHVLFYAHWDKENADRIALQNMPATADRLVAFIDAKQSITLITYLVILFKKAGKSVLTIPIGEKVVK